MDQKNPIFICVLFFELTQFFFIIFSLLYFLLSYGVSTEFINLFNKLLVLPLYTKYKLAGFTIMFAIPNKVIVHNGMPTVI
jgi:hypothetical protein